MSHTNAFAAPPFTHKRPFIIGVEGVSGAGKTTQVALLHRRLTTALPEFRIAAITEFSRSPLGHLIRELAAEDWRILLQGKRRAALAETFMLLADRLYKMENMAGRSGCDIFITDRWELSNLAHGCARISAAYPALGFQGAQRWIHDVLTLMPRFSGLLVRLDVPWVECRRRFLRRERIAKIPTAAEKEMRLVNRLYVKCTPLVEDVIHVDGDRPIRVVNEEIITEVIRRIRRR